jgi:hypothetical protein
MEGRRMSNISRDDVIAKFGPLDDVVAAEIIATGATPEDMEVARAWIARDTARANVRNGPRPAQ